MRPGEAHAASPWIDVSPSQALELLRSDAPPLFLDVRTQAEYRGAHIPGAVNIPHTEIAQRIDEIRAHGDRPIVVFCEMGGRARTAAEALGAAGFDKLYHLLGDMRAWRQGSYPVVSGSEPDP